jgi:hypothetical protein
MSSIIVIQLTANHTNSVQAQRQAGTYGLYVVLITHGFQMDSSFLDGAHLVQVSGQTFQQGLGVFIIF